MTSGCILVLVLQLFAVESPGKVDFRPFLFSESAQKRLISVSFWLEPESPANPGREISLAHSYWVRYEKTP